MPTRRERVGEGVYRRVDMKGVITYYISYKNDRKKLTWEKVGKKDNGVTPQYCKQIRNQIIAKINNGAKNLPIKSEKVTFDEASKDFMENVKLMYKDKKGSIQRYEDHIKPHIGHKQIEKITKQDVENVLKIAINKGLQPATVDRIRQTISAIFNLAIHNEKCSINPASLAKNDSVSIMRKNKKSINNNRERFLTKEEARLLLDELEKRNQKIHLMVLISLTTGARAGEILNIKFKDIDYKHKFITLPETKNGTSRKIKITPNVELHLNKFAKGEPNEYLFISEKGNKFPDVPTTYTTIVNKLFNKGLDASDAKNRVVFHTLRHTFASWLAQDGVAIYTIKELMGHKDITQTMRYAKLSPNIGIDAVINLENKLMSTDE